MVAAVLAYALTPVVDRLDNLGRGRMPRLLAVVVIEILFCWHWQVALLMVPILAKELPLMRDQLPALMDAVNAAIKPWLKQWGARVAGWRQPQGICRQVPAPMSRMPWARFWLLSRLEAASPWRWWATLS